ncbi:MAG TPA: hypothetical protein VFT95_16885 [Micromonosporaceae bacterium]|nr:hypothetical protein [Micromonosporaceae bacterium]
MDVTAAVTAVVASCDRSFAEPTACRGLVELAPAGLAGSAWAGCGNTTAQTGTVTSSDNAPAAATRSLTRSLTRRPIGPIPAPDVPPAIAALPKGRHTHAQPPKAAAGERNVCKTITMRKSQSTQDQLQYGAR